MKRFKKGKAKKINAQGVQNQHLSPKQYIRQKARSLPLKGCWVNSDWEEVGLAHVIVAREHKGGNVTYGSYLVDLSCKGLKDTSFAFRESRLDYEQAIEHLKEEAGIIPTDMELALRIIHQGILFGDKYGFSPPAEFDEVTVFLTDTPDTEDEEGWMKLLEEEVPVGVGGRPKLVVYPHQDPRRDIARLKKYAGEGYFDVAFVDEYGKEVDYWEGGVKGGKAASELDYDTERREELLSEAEMHIEAAYELFVEHADAEFAVAEAVLADVRIAMLIDEDLQDAPEEVTAELQAYGALEADASVEEVAARAEQALKDGTAGVGAYECLINYALSEQDITSVKNYAAQLNKLGMSDSLYVWCLQAWVYTEIHDYEALASMVGEVTSLHELFPNKRYAKHLVFAFYNYLVLYRLDRGEPAIVMKYIVMLDEALTLTEKERRAIHMLEEEMDYEVIKWVTEHGYNDALITRIEQKINQSKKNKA